MDALNTGGNLLLIILGFCLLIALHELGHFLAARWAGIRVHAFAIGMGPVVLAFRKGIGVRFGSTDRAARERFGKPVHRMSDSELAEHGLGETEYSLRLLPIGGFVGMLGQDDADPSARSDDPRSYQRTSIGRRMVVVSAGVIANLLLAIVLFMVAFLVGVRFESPVLGLLPADGAAARAKPIGEATTEPGLRAGDRVLSIDGTPALTFADVRIAAAMSRPGRPLEIVVDRPGAAQPLRFQAEAQEDPRGGVRTLDVTPALNTTITSDRRVLAEVDTALEALGLGSSGLGPGWTLLTIDGVPATLGDDLVTAADSSAGRPLATSWRSPDGARTLELAIPTMPELLIARRSGNETTPALPGDAHLLGLTPLVEVAAVEKGHANELRLEPGDIILRAGDRVGPSARTLVELVRAQGAGPIPLEVMRQGTTLQIEAMIAEAEFVGDRPPRLGITLSAALDKPLLAASTAGESPAASLALLPLSRIESIDGQPVQSWPDLRRALDAALQRGLAAAARPIVVPMEVVSPTVDRTHRTVELRVSEAEANEILALGWSPRFALSLFDPLDEVITAHGNPVAAVAMGFRQTWRLVLLTYLTLDRLVRGTVAVKELHGPVGIVHIGSRVADRGFMYLVFFLAMISVNLAVLNFLPLPIVDGGLFVYLIYEKLRGRPPSVAFQNAAAILGLMLIVGVFLVASYNDVMRLFGRG